MILTPTRACPSRHRKTLLPPQWKKGWDEGPPTQKPLSHRNGRRAGMRGPRVQESGPAPAVTTTVAVYVPTAFVFGNESRSVNRSV